MKRIFYLFFVAVAFFACSKDSVETFPGGITGSVSDKTTGEPVATVNVSLSPGGQSTVTGSDGSFSFEELNEGTYVIAIRKEGYLANDGKFSVVQGKQTLAHLLIERIPAVVTTDPAIVDFGSNVSVNTLSFKIVNSSYENLAWEIEHNCPWIQEVKPKSGTLGYGKTETIVVVINRDLLDAGENKTVLVVKSTNGSSQVEVKAVGTERVLPVLNTLPITNVTRSSATLNGEILNAGTPAYTERGFVYNTEPVPTLENTLQLLTAPVTDSAVYSCHVDGLSVDHRYYVRAYAKNNKGVSYSSNEFSFQPSAIFPQVSIRGSTDVNVSAGTAVLLGRIDHVGEPAYTERGFVYGTISNPTVENTKVVVPGSGTGDFSASIAELSLNQTYYVRVYAINELGVVYSSSEISFTTQTTLPEVSVQDVTDINVSDGTAVLHGTIISVGEPAYMERGFVYGTISNPTVENTKVVVTGSGTGAFSASIAELSLNQTYYVRAYAMNETGVVYSSTEISFVTETTLPQVSVQEATDINVSDGTAVLHGTIVSVGDPVYTERGFVYGIISNPTVEEDTKIVVNGTGAGKYSADVANLPLDQLVYVRSYAINEIGIVYSPTSVSVSTKAILPEVTTQDALDVDMAAGTAVLRGTIITTGTPAYTERGFVYGTVQDLDIRFDNKIIVSGNGSGTFRTNASNLPTGKEYYYVRAYVVNRGGTVYGNVVAVSSNWIVLEASGIAVQKTDIGYGNWTSMNAMCRNSSLGGYTDWRLPTKEELMTLYTNRNTIGGFTTVSSSSNVCYWSSDLGSVHNYCSYYYCINFSSGYLNYDSGSTKSARCVRTLK
ncbi:MAG: DUF1566 domain-containing protein [Oscillibacter sp.]|nr:DUF1566 domain-containing protein [Oscillibacter sp.]